VSNCDINDEILTGRDVVISCRGSVEVISQHSFGGSKEKHDKISHNIRCPGYIVNRAPSDSRGISWGVNAAGV